MPEIEGQVLEQRWIEAGFRTPPPNGAQLAAHHAAKKRTFGAGSYEHDHCRRTEARDVLGLLGNWAVIDGLEFGESGERGAGPVGKLRMNVRLRPSRKVPLIPILDNRSQAGRAPTFYGAGRWRTLPR